MTDKKKKRVRDLSAKTGMSHQAAVNALTPKKLDEPGEALSCFVRDFTRDAHAIYDTDGLSFVLEGGIPREVHGRLVSVPFREAPPTEEEAWSLLLAMAMTHRPVAEGDAFLIEKDLELWKTITRDGVTLCLAYPEFVGRHCFGNTGHGLIAFNPHAVVRQISIEESIEKPSEGDDKAVAPGSEDFLEMLQFIQNYAHQGGYQVITADEPGGGYVWHAGHRAWVSREDFVQKSLAKATPSPWVNFVKSSMETAEGRESLARSLGAEVEKKAVAPHTSNPVHQDTQGWWFYDETWSDRRGPYPTERAAVRDCQRYAEFLEYGPEWRSKTTKKFLLAYERGDLIETDWEVNKVREVKASEGPKEYKGLDLYAMIQPLSALMIDPEKKEMYRKFYNDGLTKGPDLEDAKDELVTLLQTTEGGREKLAENAIEYLRDSDTEMSPRVEERVAKVFGLPEGAEVKEIYLNSHQIDSDPDIRAIYQLEEERAEKAKAEMAEGVMRDVEFTREMIAAEREGRPARLFEEYVSDPDHLKALFNIWRTRCAPGSFASRTHPAELKLGVEFGGRLTWFPMTMLKVADFKPECFEWWKSLPEGGSVFGKKPVPRSVFAPIEEIECADLLAMFDEIRGYARSQRMRVRSADVGLKLGWAVDSRRPEVPGKHWVISLKNVQMSLKLSTDHIRVELIGKALKSKEGREKLTEALNNGADEPKA